MVFFSSRFCFTASGTVPKPGLSVPGVSHWPLQLCLLLCQRGRSADALCKRVWCQIGVSHNIAPVTAYIMYLCKGVHCPLAFLLTLPVPSRSDAETISELREPAAEVCTASSLAWTTPSFRGYRGTILQPKVSNNKQTLATTRFFNSVTLHIHNLKAMTWANEQQ